ncbi:MAG: hypothetical protein A4E53_04658 [Pelotomaculum sp. PtaB.Bin104]|nr:MAG: hypothetical protein A4E53_04658 [Pelotomaculum sp. PtaB.Bin104]
MCTAGNAFLFIASYNDHSDTKLLKNSFRAIGTVNFLPNSFRPPLTVLSVQVTLCLVKAHQPEDQKPSPVFP